MATKKKNERCPLQGECEKVCTFTYHERDCEYYQGNNRPGAEIQDQVEAVERELEERELEQLADAGNMVNIPIGRLSPHPDNPRKDLGDLTELANSIKENGILQNLTVVKRMGEITGEFVGSYTVVIGHRRLAAAKLAGMTELPCVVVDMTLQDQVRTMLMENIQRADLTVYEQAQGFQLMLNLGDSVDEIARKSGFSQTTVRRRVKLLTLDQEKFRASVDRGATLFDLMELDKIENADRKNEVLEYAGTENFKYKLKQALDKEKEEKRIAEMVAVLSAFATQIDSDDGYCYVQNFSSYDKPESIIKPEDADDVPYFFTVTTYGYIRLLKEKTDQDEDAAEKERMNREKAALEERKAGLKAATKRAFDLRNEFASSVNIATAKAFLPDIVAFSLWNRIESMTDVDEKDALDMLGITLDEENDEELTYDMVVEPVAQAPERILWAMVYCETGDDSTEGYSHLWNATYAENEGLDRLYALLVKMGYEMSDEEKQLQDGSHELFMEVKE